MVKYSRWVHVYNIFLMLGVMVLISMPSRQSLSTSSTFLIACIRFLIQFSALRSIILWNSAEFQYNIQQKATHNKQCFVSPYYHKYYHSFFVNDLLEYYYELFLYRIQVLRNMTHIRQKNYNSQLRIRKTSKNLQFDQSRTHSRNKSGQTTLHNSKHTLFMPNIIFQTPKAQYTIRGIIAKDNNGELQHDEYEDLDSNRLTSAKQSWCLDRNDLMRNFPLSYFENVDLLYRLVGRKRRFQARSCRNLKKINKEQRQKEIRISGDQNLNLVFKNVEHNANSINANQKGMKKNHKQFQVKTQRIDMQVDHKDKQKTLSQKKLKRRLNFQAQNKAIQELLKVQNSNQQSNSRGTLYSHKKINQKQRMKEVQQNKQNQIQVIQMMGSQRNKQRINGQVTDQNIDNHNISNCGSKDRRNRLVNRNKQQLVTKQESSEEPNNLKIVLRNNIQSPAAPIVSYNRNTEQLQKMLIPLSKRSLKCAVLSAHNKIRKASNKKSIVQIDHEQVAYRDSIQKEQDSEDKKTVKFGEESRLEELLWQNEDKRAVFDANIIKEQVNKTIQQQTQEIVIQQLSRSIAFNKMHKPLIASYQRKLSNQSQSDKQNKGQISITKQTDNNCYNVSKQSRVDGQSQLLNNRPIRSAIDDKNKRSKKDANIQSNTQQQPLAVQTSALKQVQTQLPNIYPCVLENDGQQQKIERVCILADGLECRQIKESKIDDHELKIDSIVKDQSHDDLSLQNQHLTHKNREWQQHSTKQCPNIIGQYSVYKTEDKLPQALKNQGSSLLPVIDCSKSNGTGQEQKPVQISGPVHKQIIIDEVESKAQQRIKHKFINDIKEQENSDLQHQQSNQVQILFRSFNLTPYNSQILHQEQALKDSIIKIEDCNSEDQDYTSNDIFNISPSTCEVFNKNTYKVRQQERISQENEKQLSSVDLQQEQIKKTPYFHRVPQLIWKRLSFEGSKEQIKINNNQPFDNKLSNYKPQKNTIFQNTIFQNTIFKQQQLIKQEQGLSIPDPKFNKHRAHQNDQLSIGSEEINHFYNQFMQLDNFYPHEDSFVYSDKKQRQYVNKPCQSNLLIEGHQDIQPENKKDIICDMNNTKKSSLKSIEKILIPFTDSADCINSTTFIKNLPQMHKKISIGSKASIFSIQSDTHKGTNQRRQEQQVSIPEQFDEQMLYQSGLLSNDKQVKKQSDQKALKVAVQENQQYVEHEKLEQSMIMIDLPPNPIIKNQKMEYNKPQSMIVQQEKKQAENVHINDGQSNSIGLALRTHQQSSFFHLNSEEQAEIDRDVNNFRIQDKRSSSQGIKLIDQRTNIIKKIQEAAAHQSKPKIIVKSRGSCIKATKRGDNKTKEQDLRASKSMKQLKQKNNQYSKQFSSAQLEQSVHKTKQIVRPVNAQIPNIYLMQSQQIKVDPLNTQSLLKFQSEMIILQDRQATTKNEQKVQQISKVAQIQKRKNQDKEDVTPPQDPSKENNGATLRLKKNERMGFHKTYDINIVMNLRASNESSLLSLQHKQKQQMIMVEVPLKKQTNIINGQALDIGLQGQQVASVKRVEQVTQQIKIQAAKSRKDLQVIQDNEVQLLKSNIQDKQVQNVETALRQQDRVIGRVLNCISINQNNSQIKIGKDDSINKLKDEQVRREPNFQLIEQTQQSEEDQQEKQIINGQKAQLKDQIIEKQLKGNLKADEEANSIQIDLSIAQKSKSSLKKVKQIYCALQEKYIGSDDLLQKKQLIVSIAHQQPTHIAQSSFERAADHIQQQQKQECLQIQSKIKQQMQDIKQSCASQRKAKEDTMQTIRQSYQPSKADAQTNTLDPLQNFQEHDDEAQDNSKEQQSIASISKYCNNFDLRINHLPESSYEVNEKCWQMIKSIIFFIDSKGQFYNRLIDKQSVWLFTDQQNNTFQRYSKSSEIINQEDFVKQTVRRYLGNKYKHNSYGEKLSQEETLKLYFQLLFGMPVLLVRASCYNKLDNLYRHHNIFGFTYGYKTVWRIVGTVQSKKQKEQKYIRLENLKTKELSQISWSLFLSEFDCSFITGFFYNYFYRGISFQSTQNQKISGQTFTARLKVPFQNEQNKKHHFLMGAKFQTPDEQVSGKVMVYMKVKSEKQKEEHFKYLGSGDIFLLSMRLKAGDYLIVLQIATKLTSCLGGKLLMASEIKDGELRVQQR